ncbi:hypothetical protein AAH450_08125 [Erwinia sp. P7711]|uniref:gp53-like domain-containing protein n=1 Tax=Erwinia sp. P7711 TaxID=3141451 RepID=UPI00318E3DB7
MHRIDTSTAQVDKFGAGKNGFTGGNPQTGELATALDADFFDSVQEEICNLIESAGLTPDKGDNSQLLKAVEAMLTALKLGTASKKNVGNGVNQIPDMSFFSVGSGNNYYRFPNGMIVQIFGITPSTTVVDTPFTFPLQFPNGGVGVFGCYNGGTAANFYSFNNVTKNGGNMRVFAGGSSTPTTGGGTAAVLAIGY